MRVYKTVYKRRQSNNSRRWMNRFFNIKETEIYEYEFCGRFIRQSLAVDGRQWLLRCSGASNSQKVGRTQQYVSLVDKLFIARKRNRLVDKQEEEETCPQTAQNKNTSFIDCWSCSTWTSTWRRPEDNVFYDLLQKRLPWLLFVVVVGHKKRKIWQCSSDKI